MTKDRVNEIDLLRFLAALSVVLFHYAFRGYAADGLSNMPYPLLAPYAKYGYLGVELFFMISGFVILMTASGVGLRSFVVSRVVRLYPAFWACCSITFAMIRLLPVAPYQVSWSQYLANMTMLSGFFDVPSVDNDYWSLFVELKFYALVAVILLLRRISQVQLWLWLWLAISWANQLVHSGKVLMVFMTDYSGFFIAGAAFYLIWSSGASLARWLLVLLSWGLGTWQALQTVSGVEHHYGSAISRGAVVAIIAVYFAAMLLIALRRSGWMGRRRWLLAGVLTYPLYLLHQNIGFMLIKLEYPAWNPHLVLWSLTAGMCVAAYLVHVLVERRLAGPMKRGLLALLEGGRKARLGPQP